MLEQKPIQTFYLSSPFYYQPHPPATTAATATATATSSQDGTKSGSQRLDILKRAIIPPHQRWSSGLGSANDEAREMASMAKVSRYFNSSYSLSQGSRLECMKSQFESKVNATSSNNDDNDDGLQKLYGRSLTAKRDSLPAGMGMQQQQQQQYYRGNDDCYARELEQEDSFSENDMSVSSDDEDFGEDTLLLSVLGERGIFMDYIRQVSDATPKGTMEPSKASMEAKTYINWCVRNGLTPQYAAVAQRKQGVVDMQYRHVGRDPEIKSLSESFRVGPAVKKLNLRGCVLSHQNCADLLKGITENAEGEKLDNALAIVDLSENKHLGVNFELYSELWLPEMLFRGVTHLNLDGLGLTDIGTANLVHHIMAATAGSRSKLQHLSLRANNIGSRGAISLARMLQDEQIALKSLDVSWNSINDEGEKSIFFVLQNRNQCLEDFRIAWNLLGAHTTIQQWKNLVRSHPTLNIIDIRCNKFPQDRASVALSTLKLMEQAQAALKEKKKAKMGYDHSTSKGGGSLTALPSTPRATMGIAMMPALSSSSLYDDADEWDSFLAPKKAELLQRAPLELSEEMYANISEIKLRDVIAQESNKEESLRQLRYIVNRHRDDLASIFHFYSQDSHGLRTMLCAVPTMTALQWLQFVNDAKLIGKRLSVAAADLIFVRSNWVVANPVTSTNNPTSFSSKFTSSSLENAAAYTKKSVPELIPGDDRLDIAEFIEALIRIAAARRSRNNKTKKLSCIEKSFKHLLEKHSILKRAKREEKLQRASGLKARRPRSTSPSDESEKVTARPPVAMRGQSRSSVVARLPHYH